jgi:hypothetical protein
MPSYVLVQRSERAAEQVPMFIDDRRAADEIAGQLRRKGQDVVVSEDHAWRGTRELGSRSTLSRADG